MAIDWGSVIGAVIDNAGEVVTAVKYKPGTPGLPSTATPGYVPSVGQTVADALGIQQTADNVVKKSIGASLKQYWYVIAIPVVLIAIIALRPFFTKKKRW